MHSDPLRQAKQELTWAWDSVHALAKATKFDQAEVLWRQALNHIEKIWIKAERGCQSFRAQFEPWQRSYKDQRALDPLLLYLCHARHADNHSIQEVADVTAGALSGTFGQQPTIRWHGPELVALPVVNYGVTYAPPISHLGQAIETRHPVVIASHGCNYYADYLRAIHSQFLAGAP